MDANSDDKLISSIVTNYWQNKDDNKGVGVANKHQLCW